jgi:hypothetical protein
MELNFINITCLGVSGLIIIKLANECINKNNYITKILSLPKDKQDQIIINLVNRMKIYRDQIYFWPLICIIMLFSIKIANQPIDLYIYPALVMMVIFYIYFITGYFFQKKLIAQLTERISQHNS